MSSAAMESPRRMRLIAWLSLGCAVALAAVFMSLAASTTREPRRAIGNGVGRYVRVTTTTDAGLTAAAWVALASGTAAWAWLYRRSTGTGLRVPIVLVAVVVLVTGYQWVVSPLLAGDGFTDSERYADVPAVIGALRSSDMPCAQTASAPTSDDAGLFAERRVCRQPNRADIRDGHDEVVVGVFAGDGARDRWTAKFRHEDVYAVIGPQWVSTCDYLATCARIQAAIGGRNY